MPELTLRLGDPVRRRRLIAGVATALVVHLAAWFLISPMIDAHAKRGAGIAVEANSPAIDIELVQSLPSVALPTLGSPDPAPSRTVSVSHVLTGSTASPARAAASGLPGGGGSDDDALFRIVFLNAVGQANAGLRGGLGCAHVDLAKLPRPMLDLCKTAPRLAEDTQLATAKPSRPLPPGIDPRWLVKAGPLVDRLRPGAP